MRLNKKIAILLSIATTIVNAQKLELGKVSIEELQEKNHPKDSSAVAAILFKKGNVYFDYSSTEGFTMVTKVITKIKIYKKEGYNWANQSVNYYIGKKATERVSISDAVTYNLVEGKIVKTKLKSDGEFVEKKNKFWNQIKIVMPNVQEGSIIEFEYIIKSPNYATLKDWDFQTTIPVNYSEFTTNIPEYFKFNTQMTGGLSPKIQSVSNNKAYRGTHGLAGNNAPGVFATASGTYNYEYLENSTTYVLSDIMPLKDENYVNNIKNYSSSIFHELSSVKIPGQRFESYVTNWESVAKTIYENDYFGPELNKTDYFKEDVNSLMSRLTTKDEKVSTLFNFVKSKINWNGYNGYTCDEGVITAYKNKTGNTAEINLMLTAMLRYAGINANPVLVSTRSNGISVFPSRSAYNYVITAVENENNITLLDATEKFSTPNILPLQDLNWFGRLIRKDGTSEEIDLMPKTISKEVSNISVGISSEGIINGKIRKQFSNHFALSFRQKYVNLKKESYLETLESENNNIEITDYVRENETELLSPIVENYSFKDSKSAEKIEDKIYISPLLFLGISENPFKQEKREYPVDFGYPAQEKYNISIEIPEGYIVESLPAPINLITGEDNIGKFKYMIENTENKIQIVIITDINTAIVSTDYYEVLKDFFQKMIDKQNEKIVLKKRKL